MLPDAERTAGDGRNQRDLVSVGERLVALRVAPIDGVEQPLRLVPEIERRPHVAHARHVLEFPLGDPRPLAETGEEPHLDRHRAQPNLGD